MAQNRIDTLCVPEMAAVTAVKDILTEYGGRRRNTVMCKAQDETSAVASWVICKCYI